MDWSAPPRRTPTCPVEHTLLVVGGQWATLVVRELLGGRKRFGELRATLGAVSPKTLTEKLRRLESQGLVSRHAYAEVPPRVEYELTEQGHTLEPVLRALWEWGERDQLVGIATERARAGA